MKRFWNYIFYFTWQLHNVINDYVDKTFDYLCSLSKFWDKHKKREKKDARNVVDSYHYKYNRGIAFKCMLTSSNIVVACLLLYITIFFEIDLKNDFNIGVFIVVLVLISYFLNNILLGWEKEGYLSYFREFSKYEHKKSDYVLAILFHLCAATVGLVTIFLLN